MILKTEKLRSYLKSYHLVRQAGNPYYETIYLDFEKEELFFRNDDIMVKIKIEVEKEEGENPENLSVDGMQFSSLVNEYPQLEIKKRLFFSPAGDRFGLKCLVTDPITVDFQKQSETWETISVNLSADLIKHFRLSKAYSAPDPHSPFKNLFFQKGSLIAFQRSKVYIAKTPEVPVDFSIPTKFSQILASMEEIQGESNISFLKKPDGSTSKLIFTREDISFLVSASNFGAFPYDISDEAFKRNYLHQHVVKFSTEELMSSLYFVLRLMGTIINYRVKISFAEDSGQLVMVIQVLDDSDITYAIPIHEHSKKEGIINKSFWISLMDLKNAVQNIRAFKADNTYIRFDPQAPTISIGTHPEDSDLFLIQTLLEDPAEL